MTNNIISNDTYSFTELDRYLFGQGTHYEIYKKLGAHVGYKDGHLGVFFAVWAPNAKSISVVGDFNNWEKDVNKMEKLPYDGIFECFIENAQIGDRYKFKIETPQGRFIDKADPYAKWAELRPGTASKIYDDRDYAWEDQEWIEKRTKSKLDEEPMSIYEVHIGSWKKDYSNENETGFYSYIRFAAEICKYVKEMGYTHVELIGIAEHPLDASWGYQVSGYYAPTSRYGSPDEFKYLVNYLHKHGIGVILDWVPAHFPKDAFALADFDGYAVYEHADPRKGEHPEWSTKIFNYGRPEVSNFLIANALYWVDRFHIDGLRVDAVASMLYLDYGRGDDWVANELGGNENLEAIEFIKHFNSIMHKERPGVVTIAEDSTAWPMVTGAPEDGGLGFSFKWNMGWMHDFLEYMKIDAFFRKYHHNKMNFSITYAFSEKYVLVLSHDEVVHLKKSMFEKYPGTEDEKYNNLKAAYAFMMGHPGKKLLFMGNEFGQRREWSEERELDWGHLVDSRNYNLREFLKNLLQCYKEFDALSKNDQKAWSFEWINADDASRSIFSFIRWDESGKDNLLFVCNFTPVDRNDFRVGVPIPGNYELVLSSRSKQFGEEDHIKKIIESDPYECDNRADSIGFKLKGFEAVIFKFDVKRNA